MPILGIFSALGVFLGWHRDRKRQGLEDHMLAGRNPGIALGLGVLTWMFSHPRITTLGGLLCFLGGDGFRLSAWPEEANA